VKRISLLSLRLGRRNRRHTLFPEAQCRHLHPATFRIVSDYDAQRLRLEG
jgi:hypothetical protein